MVSFALKFYVHFLDPKSSPSRMTAVPLQPLRTTPGNKPTGVTRGQGAQTPVSSGETAEPVSVEAFSGLRLRSVTGISPPHTPPSAHMPRGLLPLPEG